MRRRRQTCQNSPDKPRSWRSWLFQPLPGKRCPHQGSLLQICGCKIGTAEIGHGKISAEEICALEITAGNDDAALAAITPVKAGRGRTATIRCRGWANRHNREHCQDSGGIPENARGRLRCAAVATVVTSPGPVSSFDNGAHLPLLSLLKTEPVSRETDSPAAIIQPTLL